VEWLRKRQKGEGELFCPIVFLEHLKEFWLFMKNPVSGNEHVSRMVI
jgi:hypothetical protein